MNHKTKITGVCDFCLYFHTHKELFIGIILEKLSINYLTTASVTLILPSSGIISMLAPIGMVSFG